jgi:Fibronectin-attachment protein (FAP)
MDQPDAIREHRKGLSKSLAIAALTGATAVALTLPTIAHAQPSPTPPPPAPPSGNTFMQGPPPPGEPVPPAAPVAPGAPVPPPADPNAPVPPPLDPNAPPAPPADPNAPPAPPADPNAAPPPAPEPGRVDNAAGGLSFVVPAGWQVSDSTQLSYGQALLTKIAPEGGQPPNDTSVLLGRLDLKLFAGAETDNTKAAQRLASDMGEFFMPFPGTRINQETVTLDAAGMPGVASYYEVKFTDTNKPTGQIWAGVVGEPVEPGTPRGQRTPARWFVVWLGTATNPVPKGEATTLANSIRPFAPPPAPAPAPVDPNAPPPPPDPNAPPPDPNAPTADPNAPPAPDPNAPPARPGVGVAVPVAPEAAPGMMPPA